MRIMSAIARILLGVIFLFFGLNLWLHFLPNPPLPPGPMADFSHALSVSHYMEAIAFFQVIPAILLLINRYVPLALTVLAAMILNIDLTHILMAPSGLPIAALVTLLWILVFVQIHAAFQGIFQAKVAG